MKDSSTPDAWDRLDYPLDFTIKVFLSLDGRDPAELGEELARRAEGTGSGAVLLEVSRNLSAKSNYACYSMTFRTSSKDELFILYSGLREHPGVRMML